MDKIQFNLDYYNKIYDKHQWTHIIWSDLHYRPHYLHWFIKQNLGELENQAIFEHGFGDGKLLTGFTKNNELYGSEIIPIAIQKANQKFSQYQKADFRMVENETIPFTDDSFDLTLCSHLLEHVADDKKIIKELIRVTKKGQYLVIVIPINEKPGQDPRHLREYTTENFLELLGNKIKIVALQEYDSYFFYTTRNLWNHSLKKGKVPIHIKLSSIAINTVYSLIPFPLMKTIDTKLIRMSKNKKPHQLIIIGQKL